MKYFRLSLPTTIVFEPGAFSRLGRETAAVGKRALLVSYADVGPLAALLGKAVGSLRSAGVEVVTYEAVEPNPRLDTCDRGAELLRESDCDLIVAIGGGSAIDASKAISAAAANGRSCWDFCRRPGGLAPLKAAVPIVAVPTTAATGSEANCEAVISNPHTREKCVLGNPLLAPRVAICDPKLHLSIPREATADGCVDIISHCLESYLSGEPDCSVQDRLTEGVMNVVFHWGPVAVENGGDLRARRELQYAALLGISDLIHAGRGGTWLMHNIEHAVSGHYDIPHGRGMAVVIPRVMRKLFLKHVPNRLALLGRRCFGLDIDDDQQAAEAAVDAFIVWLASIGRDLSLSALGIGREKFEAMADDVIRNDGDGIHYHSVVDLDHTAIVDILQASL
jgi:alcohol dehydrogenase YqhD (iron-dependent ADH family)